MISWRLVVVSLVVGVVLAVGSVGVGVALAGRSWMPSPRQTLVTYFTDEHRVDAELLEMPGMSTHIWGLTELGAVRDLDAYTGAIAGVVQQDPRPPRVVALHDPQSGVFIEFRAGWPLLATRGHLRVPIIEVQPGTPPPGAGGGAPGLWRFELFGGYWSVPYLPLWPGLLGNVLFYTLLVLTPIALWRWRKLRRRERRGLCVACGYELGEGVGACPECGLTKRAC